MRKKSNIPARRARQDSGQPQSAQVSLRFSEALKLHKAGQLKEAENVYNQVLAVQPDHFDSLHLRGVIFHQRGDHAAAVRQIDFALKINPNNRFALNNRGLALKELKRFAEALASYDRALSLRPDFAEALSNRGVTLYELKRLDEALASYDRALAVRPDYAEALYNRGNTLDDMKRFEEALASYDRALALWPHYVEALLNRGNTLQKLKRFEEALASYDRVLMLRPDYAEALTNRGLALHELRRFEEALASYDRAIAFQPDYAQAHFNRAVCRMLIGDFDRGWEQYKWRWHKDTFTSPQRNFVQSPWLGADIIADKTILLHSEQGFGDTIQFCRFVPLVTDRAAHVILEVPNPLSDLMGTLSSTAQTVSNGEPLPDFDVHCPLLSLPMAFRTRLESIPSTTPYLHAPARAMQHWKTLLGQRDRPRIGICWAGNAKFKGDLSRSIGLLPMLPLLANKDVQFFSLQKDLRAGDPEILDNNRNIIHLGQDIKTFSDTAAILSLMDLVISSDTSVVHLAGALAKPVWILLQFVPDWRWLLDREDSPWYPTARLFRQDDTRDWGSVIARVDVALRASIHSL